jgi:hypothetical protein
MKISVDALFSGARTSRPIESLAGSEQMSLTRRALLRGVTTTGAVAGLYPIIPPEAVHAHPAILAASAAIQVISGFIGRSDDIGPYLQAINQKLDLVVGQLRQVQNALADIAEGIASLQAAIPEMIEDAETKGKVKDLVALASQWFDYGVPDAAHFDALSRQRKQSAVQMGTNIETLIYWFSTAAQGGTPQAAVATPLALAIHLNVVSLTHFRPPSAALQPHFGWYEKILDPSLERSVAWWLRSYTAHRGALLSRIGDLQLGKMSGFDSTKQRSEHPGLEWNCHMEGDPIYYPGGVRPQRTPQPRHFLSGVFRPKPQMATRYSAWTMRRFRLAGMVTGGVDYHRRFVFDDRMIPKRFNDVAPPTSCRMSPDRVSRPPWITPEFKRLLDERDLLLERDGDKRPGLIPQVNDLNARIALTENILKIAQSARDAALRFKRDVQ